MVKELIDIAIKVTRFDIEAVKQDRILGDPTVLIASLQKAQELLKCKP